MNHKVVGLGRLELPTSPLSGVRSNQLSYRPRTSYTNPAKRTWILHLAKTKSFSFLVSQLAGSNPAYKI